MADHRLSIRLSHDAYRGVQKAVRVHGVTATAVVEAAGRLLLEDPGVLDRRVLELAREIDAERRARG